MSEQSFFYRHPRLYQGLMRGLYRSSYAARYRALAELIAGDETVVDLCAGDCALHLRELSGRQVRYLGVDRSAAMLEIARLRGTATRVLDLTCDPVPPADVIVMQASLYQFMPAAESMVERMLKAARRRVLIAEPVRNLSDSDNPIVAALSRRLTRPGGPDLSYKGHRFNAASFSKLCQSFDGLEKLLRVQGGREMIAVLRGRRRRERAHL